MVFSSITFTFFFLPIFLIFYYTLPFKNIILLIFSLIFYAWGEPIYILLMIFSSVVDFNIGKKIEKSNNKKIYLILSILINLLLLSFFKYSDFLINNINLIFNLNIKNLNLALPIGISFFTFQTMSYSIDVYRDRVRAEKSFLNFLTYVCMFPQLIAGPIVRYQTISEELSKRETSFKKFYEGLTRFLEGLFQKVLLANNIGFLYVSIISVNINELSILSLWLAIVCFTLQIYFDFSGYSSMAIGIGKMLGFNYPENFNYPFMSTSISDFWRRWHMTLGSWFRDYVYIPLGGNKYKMVRNLFIVWFLTGLWHGASYNFILWGLYFGILLYIEKKIINQYIQKVPVFIKRISTIFLIIISFFIFAFESGKDIINYGKILFGFSTNIFVDNNFIFDIYNNLFLIIICLIFTMPMKKIFCERVKNDYIRGIVYMLLFILTIAYLVSSSYNPFLYFRF